MKVASILITLGLGISSCSSPILKKEKKVTVVKSKIDRTVSSLKIKNIGTELLCYPTYMAKGNIGTISRFRIKDIRGESEKSIHINDTMDHPLDSVRITSMKIDLAEMNAIAIGAKWAVATLVPDEVHSEDPVDVAFVPVYRIGAAPNYFGRLIRVVVMVGHTRRTTTGWRSNPVSNFHRISHNPYDKFYHSKVEVTIDLTKGTFAKIVLPSLNAGLKSIELECSVK